MKRLLLRMGLLGVFITTAVAGQVFFASPAYAAVNPSFDWEESFTADDKLGELQLTWCSSNLDGESVADIANFRSGASGTYIANCLDSEIGGICKTVERGSEQEYRCYRSIPDDHPLALAIKAAEANEVNPLQILYCGAPNMQSSDTARINDCYQAVKTAYFSPKCFFANQRNYNDGRSSASDAASCVRDALRNNDKIINKNRTQAQVLTAIRQGRKAANVLIQAAIKTDQARLQCIEDKGTWENGACVAEGEGGSGSGEPVCSVGALGWVICPLTDFISDATQTIARIIENQLIYPPLLDSDQGAAIRVVWGTVLGIANLGLVIAFLIIIFSQATSVGLSSYGIKKILPRLIAAAILMNLSFFLCAIAVDLANILGVSIKSIVQTGIESIDKAAPASNLKSADGRSWAAGVVGILGLGIAAFTGTIGFLVPVILAALFAVFTAFLVIAARGIIVTLLIIVAPLAFLAWILPNTEQWFTKWRKLFTTMLLLFPLVMLVFYGSLLVSRLVLVTTAGGGDGDPKIMTNIIALAILTVPLFSLPFIMKSAGGVLDRFGVLVNNRGKGLIDRSRKKSQEWRGNSAFERARSARRTETQARRNKDFYKSMAGDGSNFKRIRGKAGYTGMGASVLTKGGRQDASRTQDNISDMYRKQQTEATNRSLAGLVEGGAFSQGSTYRLVGRNGQEILGSTQSHRDMVPAVLASQGATLQVTDVAGRTSEYQGDDIQGAVASKTAQMGDVPLTESVLALEGTNAAMMREFISYNAGNYASKAPDYIKGELGAFGDPKAAEVAGWHANTSTRAATYAAQNPQAARNVAAALTEALGNDNLRGDLTTGSVRNLIGQEDSAIWQTLSVQEQGNVRAFLNSHTTQTNLPTNTPDNGSGPEPPLPPGASGGLSGSTGSNGLWTPRS